MILTGLQIQKKENWQDTMFFDYQNEAVDAFSQSWKDTNCLVPH